jgi:integrase
MTLTDTTLRRAKPKEKPYKLFDERGLFALVTPNGGKWWRLKYRIAGKEKQLSLGIYPDTGLAAARDKREQARKLIADGVDPSAARRADKASLAGAESFEAVAREWFDKFSPEWSESHRDRVKKRLEGTVYPYIGRRPIAEIRAPEVLPVLRRIEARGLLETAHRAMQDVGRVFRYAVATGRAERDPTADLKGSLPPVSETHHASLTKPDDVGALMRAIGGYAGTLVTAAALKLAPLVFVRPGELRRGEWPEFDLDKAEWRIPAHKMKARALHIVPLPKQAVAILREIFKLTGYGIPGKPDAPRYVFPSERSRERPMSENTINAALRRLGYASDQMTGHGFRSMASTMLNEQGWHRDAIERQLAHAERDGVRAAYNYAEHLPERRKMMQAWADYLDRLASGERKVTPIRRRKAA